MGKDLENKYVNNDVPPTRDERLEISDAFNGFGCDFVNCSKECCLKKMDRDFWQASSSCQMGLSTIMSSTIENSVIIMHGPIGCGHQLHGLTANTNAGKAARGVPVKTMNWLSTNLGTNEVVNGGEKRLREAIEYADRTFRPEIIFILSTCAPNIIGDDIEQIVRDEEKIVSAQVAAIHCPGFRSRMVSSAYDAFYHSLIKHVKFEPIPFKDYLPVNPADPMSEFAAAGYDYGKRHTVNLMTLESVGAPDENELSRLLNALDINVNVVPEYSNADKIRFISERALNVSMCWMHDDYLLKYLKDEYGVPYYMQMPLGLRATRKWLTDIGEHFGIKERAERLADYEEDLVKKAIEPFLSKIRDKRILVTGGSVRSAVETSLLKDDLGMDVIGIIGMLYDNNAEGVFEDFAEEHPQIPVVISDQPYEYVNQIKKLNPDIILEHANYLQEGAKCGFATIPEFDVGGSYFGYSGVFNVAKKIAFALDNDEYVKHLAKHVRFPYKKDWYDMDPYKYIRQ